MSRKGFDKRIHPYQLHLRICVFPDLEGLQNKGSVTLDFHEGKIKKYNTGDNLLKTTIREYIASDEELKELYNFFTLDAVEKFEAMSESELSQYVTGYYDWASLRYLMTRGDGQVSDGVRHHIYTNDPIRMSIEWMRKTAPFKIDI